MGIFKSMREVQRQTRQIQANTDSSAMLGGALERMQATSESMARMARAANVAVAGVAAQATIDSVAQTSTMINYQPAVKLDLTVGSDGGDPYATTVTQIVPQLYLAKATPGRAVPVRVDQADRSLVWIDWASA